MERPLKIGIVCYPTFGGSGAVATELGRILARRGHTVHFISYSRPFRLAHDDHPNIIHHKIDTMEYPLFLGPLYSISASVRIRDIILEAGLDVLHAHYALPHAVCAYLANEMLDPARRVPVLTTLHGTDITLIGSTPAFAPAVKLGLDKSTSLSCVSHWLEDKTCEYFDICERLNVIYNFVDTNLYHRDVAAGSISRSEFASDSEPLFLHVSNYRPVKCVPDVIRTFALVCARRPSRLLLVGDGPELHRSLELARELGVGDRVISLGEREDVRGFFALADLFLFPSAGESFGLAAAEAMACETPVIGAKVGGLPEVVVDGEHGFLHPVGDCQGMAGSVLRLIADEARRQEMGAAGRRRVIERFSPDLIVPQYERLYETMLRRNRAVA
jgi:L-malate glycosyltransferase